MILALTFILVTGFIFFSLVTFIFALEWIHLHYKMNKMHKYTSESKVKLENAKKAHY